MTAFILLLYEEINHGLEAMADEGEKLLKKKSNEKILIFFSFEARLCRR